MLLNILAFLTFFSNRSFPQTKTRISPAFMSLYFSDAALVSTLFFPDLMSRKIFLFVVLNFREYLFIYSRSQFVHRGCLWRGRKSYPHKHKAKPIILNIPLPIGRNQYACYQTK